MLKMTQRKLRKALVTVVIASFAAALIAPAFAAAQGSDVNCSDPTGNQYADQTQCIERQVASAGGGGSGGSSHSGLDGNVGPLPFTGFDVIAMAAVALAVTGLGLALQRAVARGPRQAE